MIALSLLKLSSIGVIKTRGVFMNIEVSNSEIPQVVTELSGQVQSLSGQLKETEERLNQKIDKLDAKVTVLSEGLLDTQAEVKILKNAK